MPTTAQTLAVLLDNQRSRTRHALAALPPELFTRDPGGEANTIRTICEHMIRLHTFQMMLIGSPLADGAPSNEGVITVDEAIGRLMEGSERLERAIDDVPEEDWLRTFSPPPMKDKWPNDPQLVRLARPFNDYSNHLGAIRAIRRVFGSPAETTQD